MLAIWSKAPNLLSQDIAESSARIAAESLLETIEGASVENGGYKPDALNRSEQDVDWVCRIGTKSFALEHTRIETFAREFELGSLWRNKLASPLAVFEAEMNESLSDKGFFLLGIYGAPAKSSFPKCIPQLKDWLLATVPSLGLKFPQNIAIKKITREDNFPVNVRLTRYPGPLPYLNAPRNFMIQRMVKFDEVGERRSIIERAFRKKTQKLAKYKQQGHISVLVLDSTAEMATGAIPIIFAAKELKKYMHAVDQVITIERDASVWGLRLADAHTLIDRSLINRWWEYRPDTRCIKLRSA
jgi:hypothetical protein